MVTDTALWQAINAYELDNADAALPFSRRLARDNGWSHSRALSAIAEYKRFIYLICHSGTTQPGTVLTPSEDVDEVWHLHLIYTQDYWDRFCGQTLGRKVHHGPTRGGGAEDDRYRDCYRRTLEIYQTEFGLPPSDVWPDPEVRFQPSPIRRIDISQTICLPKRQVFLCLSAAVPLALAGCGVPVGLVAWGETPGAMIWAGFAFTALVFLIVNLPKILRRLIPFMFVAAFFTIASTLWLGQVFTRLLGQVIHPSVDPALPHGAAALAGFLFAIWLSTLPPGRSNGGGGCGGGCSSGTFLGCSSHGSGHGGSGCGSDSGSGCGSSGCGSGCGGGGD